MTDTIITIETVHPDETPGQNYLYRVTVKGYEPGYATDLDDALALAQILVDEAAGSEA